MTRKVANKRGAARAALTLATLQKHERDTSATAVAAPPAVARGDKEDAATDAARGDEEDAATDDEEVYVDDDVPVDWRAS